MQVAHANINAKIYFFHIRLLYVFVTEFSFLLWAKRGLNNTRYTQGGKTTIRSKQYFPIYSIVFSLLLQGLLGKIFKTNYSFSVNFYNNFRKYEMQLEANKPLSYNQFKTVLYLYLIYSTKRKKINFLKQKNNKRGINLLLIYFSNYLPRPVVGKSNVFSLFSFYLIKNHYCVDWF